VLQHGLQRALQAQLIVDAPVVCGGGGWVWLVVEGVVVAMAWWGMIGGHGVYYRRRVTCKQDEGTGVRWVHMPLWGLNEGVKGGLGLPEQVGQG